MIVGIDLGTTHSLVGIHTAEGGRLFPNAHGELLTPSVVSLDGDTVLVGRPARDRLVSHPDLSASVFKRMIGTDHVFRLGARSFRAEELSALLLRSLLADAEAALGEPVSEAVISVPAYFSDAQRKATRLAGELAGIKVERLVNEPTAAALAYGLGTEGRDGRVMVLDLGGGTFDVSLIECFEGIFQVHASAGDSFLGGEDFLTVLLQEWAKAEQVDLKALPATLLAPLRQRMEAFKHQLALPGVQTLELKLEGLQSTWTLDAERFEQLAMPLLQRMRQPIERALRDARVQPAQLDEVILVGGASRMPMVGRLATRMFGRLPLRHVHPDQAIALGAAVAAALKQRTAALEEVVLTDVSPYTLGIEVSRNDAHGRYQGGFYLPVIPRNCSVPVSREQSISPLSTDQRVLRVDVYQGEHPLVTQNIALGTLEIALDPNRGGDGSFLVRFTYDVDGLLQVEVTDSSDGKRHELILQQASQALSHEEVSQRMAALQALKVHPREQQPNLALLARLQRIYAEHLHLRDDLQEWMAAFQGVLDTQDTNRINEARTSLQAHLDALRVDA